MLKLAIEQKFFDRAKVYGLIISWLLYLISLPYVFAHNKVIGSIYIVFPGIYLFPLFGLMIHETWHDYLPNVPNKVLFPLFCFMLISDPQVYDLTHRSHHTDVNSYRDMQFYPLGKIERRFFRVIFNFFSISLGAIFVMTVAGIRLPKDSRFKRHYRYRKLFLFLLCRIGFIVSIGYCSHLIFNVSTMQILIPFLFTYWGGSLMIHHGMLFEHGNLIVEGNLNQRNLKTRNLRATGLASRIVLFFTHNDLLEHTLHHTSPRLNNRPFPRKYSMPENSNYITLSQHLGILRDMLIGIEANENKQINNPKQVHSLVR